MTVCHWIDGTLPAATCKEEARDVVSSAFSLTSASLDTVRLDWVARDDWSDEIGPIQWHTTSPLPTGADLQFDYSERLPSTRSRPSVRESEKSKSRRKCM